MKTNSSGITSKEIREIFLKYFEKQGHARVQSSGLIPENDPTLLFANAGMNQFKNSFLGLEKRDYTRATTSQKCVRAGGKHNDLENVGFTARHHTFFEMLGNFSFGDYFKKDAIHFAWDLLTRELQIPKEKLYVTVFETDDEAADIWHKQEGVPRDRIYRFGEKDNFWRMGDTGPCGPCSEIFYDHGEKADLGSKPSVMGGDGDRYIEIWNLVFMQYNEDEKGKHLLPKPSVDTGGGLERWTAALQGQPNNYDTDLFQPIIQEAARISKKEYIPDYAPTGQKDSVKETTAALRVVADHTRAMTFLIADGVLPSNEGRGYVLRRIMRRAIRFASKLSDDPNLLEKTAAVVITEMSAMYPELKSKKEIIIRHIQDEVSRFMLTLQQGTEILNQELSKLSSRGQKVLSGESLFKLYDTYGFPPDLTRLMAVEKGFQADEAGFEKHMQEARAKAKSSWKGKSVSADEAHIISFAQLAKDQLKKSTEFLGYETLESKQNLALLSDGHKNVSTLKKDQNGILITSATPFYAEGGGQAGDLGWVETKTSKAQVVDVKKVQDIFLHFIEVVEGEFKVGQELELKVVDSKRRQTAAHHSATHLLHAALRKVLGTHVTQAGSLVNTERLRFDFSHNKPMTREECSEIERIVNEQISLSSKVQCEEMSHKQALAQGAMALFGEKYGDQVRVVKMGDFSVELCGGTHVPNTAAIRLFKIVSESGVSSGVRRIEALAGDLAFEYMLKNTQENLEARNTAGIHEPWSQYLESQTHSLKSYIENQQSKIKDLEKEIKKMKSQSFDLDQVVQQAKQIGNFKFVGVHIELDDRAALSEISDKLKDKLGSSVILLVGKSESAHPIVVSVSKDLNPKISAGKILGDFAKELKGKGGGRPDFAQGAGEDLSALPQAFLKVEQNLQNLV